VHFWEEEGGFVSLSKPRSKGSDFLEFNVWICVFGVDMMTILGVLVGIVAKAGCCSSSNFLPLCKSLMIVSSSDISKDWRVKLCNCAMVVLVVMLESVRDLPLWVSLMSKVALLLVLLVFSIFVTMRMLFFWASLAMYTYDVSIEKFYPLVDVVC